MSEHHQHQEAQYVHVRHLAEINAHINITPVIHADVIFYFILTLTLLLHDNYYAIHPMANQILRGKIKKNTSCLLVIVSLSLHLR